jgi:beta-lactamase regulating signal transducer with metallopeptidase domain
MPDLGSLESVARLVAQALLNGVLWGLAITALFALVLRALHRAPAATRYRLWLLALSVVVLLPLSAMWMAGDVGRERIANADRSVETATVAPGAHPGPALLSPEPTAVGSRPRISTVEVPGGPWLVVLLGLAVLIGAARCARLARSLHRLRELKRAALPLPAAHADVLEPLVRRAGAGRAVELRVSDRLAPPIAVGYLRPAILIPTALLERLTREELTHVVLHELAHVRRRDDWGLLAQRLVQAVFFFHPAAHWIGRRLERERELACDQFVIQTSPAAARSYARCLVRLAELVVASREADLAPSAAPRHTQLGYRLQALLSAGSPSHARTLRMAAATGGALLAAAAIAVPYAAPGVALQAAARPSGPSAASDPALAAVHASSAAVEQGGSVRAPRPEQTVDVPMLVSRTEGAAAEAVRLVDQGSATRHGTRGSGSGPMAPSHVVVADGPAVLRPSPLYLDPVEVRGNRAASASWVQERPAPRRGVNITVSLAGGAALDPLRVLTEPVAAGALPYPYGGQPGAVGGYPRPDPRLPVARGVELRFTGGPTVPRLYPGLLQGW